MPVPAPLSADALFKLVRQTFAQVPEHRPMHIAISLGGALMTGLALFSATVARRASAHALYHH